MARKAKDKVTEGANPVAVDVAVAVAAAPASIVRVATPYVWEQQIQEAFEALSINESKETMTRLQGVAWIESIKAALQMPIDTFCTAAMYYNRFRLVHHDSEFDVRDAAAAALLAACKIEDSIKKAREILCAAYNLKLSPTDHITADNGIFEGPAKVVAGLERQMLESSAFDFRTRNPHHFILKQFKKGKCPKELPVPQRIIGTIAWHICTDMYKTWAPVKQTMTSMALACTELALRLCEIDMASVDHRWSYKHWKMITRVEVMETMLDLLDLYTHNRNYTKIGVKYPLDTFIAIRIALNQEVAANKIPRYAQWKDLALNPGRANAAGAIAAGAIAAGATDAGTTDAGATDAGATDAQTPGLNVSKKGKEKLSTPMSTSPHSPSGTPGTDSQHGKATTVRFILDPARAAHEEMMRELYEEPDEKEEMIEPVVNAAKPTLSIQPMPADVNSTKSTDHVTAVTSALQASERPTPATEVTAKSTDHVAAVNPAVSTPSRPTPATGVNLEEPVKNHLVRSPSPRNTKDSNTEDYNREGHRRQDSRREEESRGEDRGEWREYRPRRH